MEPQNNPNNVTNSNSAEPIKSELPVSPPMQPSSTTPASPLPTIGVQSDQKDVDQSPASIVTQDRRKISRNAKIMIGLGVPLIIVGILIALLGTLVGLVFVLIGVLSIISGILSLKKANK